MKMRLLSMAMLSAVATTATPTLAGLPPIPDAVYDNILDGTEGLDFYLNGTSDVSVYDDLHLDGGGFLAGIRFSYGTEFFGGSVTGDALVKLYLDDGLSSPGTLDTNDDTELVSELVRGIVATPGSFGQFRSEEHLIPYLTPSIVIPENATIWASLTLTPTTTGPLRAVFHAPISVGSSDRNIYDAAAGTTYDTSANGLPANAGLGFEIYTFPIPEPATLSLLALGGIALIRRRRA